MAKARWEDNIRMDLKYIGIKTRNRVDSAIIMSITMRLMIIKD